MQSQLRGEGCRAIFPDQKNSKFGEDLGPLLFEFPFHIRLAAEPVSPAELDALTAELDALKALVEEITAIPNINNKLAKD